MKLFSRKSIFVYLTCFGIVLLNSCAQTPPYGEGVNIIASPYKLIVHSGSEDTIFIQLVDKQGGPFFGMKVTATSTSPTVATVTPEAITDAAGKATFTVKGISPGGTKIVLSAAGQKATVDVVFVEH